MHREQGSALGSLLGATHLVALFTLRLALRVDKLYNLSHGLARIYDLFEQELIKEDLFE